jgi:phosphoribosylanthranilate isomerase
MQASAAEAFLIDTPAGAQRGGTGRSFDWSLVQGLAGKIVLAGGLGPDNVAEAIRQVRPWGVDACSRLESAPGRKDAAKVRALIQAVREAEAE